MVLHVKKSLINIFSYITLVKTSVLYIGSIIVNGITTCMVTGSYSASYQSKNDCMALLSDINDTENSCID